MRRKRTYVASQSYGRPLTNTTNAFAYISEQKKVERKMTDDEKSHLALASLGNLTVVGLLIRSAWSGNDKAIILMIFLYPLLILINGIIWMN